MWIPGIKCTPANVISSVWKPHTLGEAILCIPILKYENILACFMCVTKVMLMLCHLCAEGKKVVCLCLRWCNSPEKEPLQWS